MLLKVQAAFSAFQSSLHIPNRYSIPPSCARCRATHRQLFSQRPKENPMKHKLRAAGIADEPIRTHHGLGYSFAET